MASYIRKKVICKYCGKEYEAKILQGYYQDTAPDLDLNPHNPAVYDEVVLCPHCKFVTTDVNRELSERERKAFAELNAEYLCGKYETYGETAYKFMTAGLFMFELGRFKEAGYFFLKATWYFQEKGLVEQETFARDCELTSFLRATEQENDGDFQVLLLLTDCMRRRKIKTNSERFARWGVLFEQDSFLKKVYEFEMKLIQEGDTAPHSLSEVQ